MGVHQIRAHNEDRNGLTPTGATCRVTGSGCVAAVTGTTSWTRGLVGRGSYVLHFTSVGDGSFRYEGVEHLDVRVAPCGAAGTFDIAIRGGVYKPLDNPGGTVYDHDRWSVIPNSGSGGLRHLTGSGREVVTDHGDGTTSADLTGTIRCGARSPARTGRTSSPTSGRFTLEGCVPVAAPRMHTDGGTELTCMSPAQFLGTWTGTIAETTTGTFARDGSVEGVNIVDLTGTAADGSCGSLHIRETFTGDALGNERSTATIEYGTGDWSGARGTYTTTGLIPGGVGTGTWTGTWSRPPITGPSSCPEASADYS